MCRALSYLGPPIPLANLLHRPDNALIRQSIAPRYLHMLNLAGFGLLSWNSGDTDPERPLSYQSTSVPVYDANLDSLAAKVSTTCTLAHVRGIAYQADAGFGYQNLHPFRFAGTPVALAHNGDLAEFARMRAPLHRRIAPDLAARMRGTTDSEHVYALILSELADPMGTPTTAQLLRAVNRALAIIREVRAELGIDVSSAMNLFLTDGRRQIALRYTFDFGRYPLHPERMQDYRAQYLSLWYTVGAAFGQDDGRWGMRGGPPRAAILASEPLSRDPAGWVEVPEYTAVVIETSGDGIAVRTVGVDA